MKIVNLTLTQYRNYSNIHSRRNFGQTIEYSMLNFNTKKKKLFLGLIDNDNNIHAAALILIRNISSTVKEAIAPNGFLIDYADFKLVAKFTDELKKYLAMEKVTYLITNPMFKYRVINKKNAIVDDNIDVLDNLYRIGYENMGYLSDFEKYDVIIENDYSINDIYNNFNRNTKRNINEGLLLGITLHKGNNDDLVKAYEIFRKKTKHSITYYQNLLNTYNNKDNRIEIFFAKLNPQKYLINVKKAYESECKKNEKIIVKLGNASGSTKEKILNKKIASDNNLEKLKNNLNMAIEFSQKHNDSVIIGTSIVVRNNHEIYFLIDGYNEEFRKIHSTHVLKWAIIKKYYSMGYRTFNLGEIHKNYNDNNKYHGMYMYKIGFGGNIVEYPPNLLLVINRPIYSLYSKLSYGKNLFKR